MLSPTKQPQTHVFNPSIAFTLLNFTTTAREKTVVLTFFFSPSEYKRHPKTRRHQLLLSSSLAHWFGGVRHAPCQWAASDDRNLICNPNDIANPDIIISIRFPGYLFNTKRPRIRQHRQNEWTKKIEGNRLVFCEIATLFFAFVSEIKGIFTPIVQSLDRWSDAYS